MRWMETVDGCEDGMQFETGEIKFAEGSNLNSPMMKRRSKRVVSRNLV